MTALESGLETGQEVGREKLQLLRPNARFARHRDDSVTLGHGAGGGRQAGSGDAPPDGLNAREEGGRRDVADDAVEGRREGARGEASHGVVGAAAGSGERQH